MKRRTHGCRLSILFAGVFAIYVAASIGCAQAAEKPPATLRIDTPATVPQAAKVLDLTRLPLVEGAEEPQCRRLACLNYNAKGVVRKVFALQQKQLTDQGWKQLADAQVADQFASATFARNGFSLAVSIYPTGTAGIVAVAVTQLGNVELEKLPVPGKAQLIFPGPASVGFVTDMTAEQATEECRKLLLEKGWQPYGTASDTLVMKQNAIRLTARVAAAPGQGGRTMVSYSTALMSADLPAPADASDVHYSDLTAELTFDTTAPPDLVFEFYRQSLGHAGWEATTDQPLKNDGTQMLIFRNPSHDLLTLEMYAVDDKTRVKVKHQTAAEIAEFDRQRKDKAKDKDQLKSDG